MKTARSPKVEVRNLQRKIPINELDLQEVGQKAAALCLRIPTKEKTNLQMLPEVSILIISDRRMASLHRRFMNQAGPTDVLTFQHGEIFISADTARRNAQRFGNPFGRELSLYAVHGLLHLHGFEDRDPISAGKMRTAEKKILTKIR